MSKQTQKKSQIPSSEQRSLQAMSRSYCYGLLALVFRAPPSSQLVAELRSEPLAEVFSELDCEMDKYLAGELEDVKEHLAEEYTSTFVGPGAHVSPYASVYHDGEGQLWGDSTVRVKRFIEATGLSFEDNWESIPDHIAIELELMQRLCAHEAQLQTRRASLAPPSRGKISKELRQCLEVEEKFLLDHLHVWVGSFCRRVLETSSSLFYQEMAKLAESIVLSDIEALALARQSLESCKCNEPQQ